MNKIDLVNKVKLYLNRPNMDPDYVSAIIQSVEGELNRELREHPRNITQYPYTVPADDYSFPLPDGVAGIITLRSGDDIYKQYGVTQVELLREQSDIGIKGFISRGTFLELFPTPDVDTEFILDYHAFLSPLENDVDTNWVSTYFPDIYLYGCLKEAAVFLKDDGRFKLWQSEFASRLAALDAQSWNQNFAAGSRSR